MGKSSLRVQTAQRLQADDIACVPIDISGMGTTSITPEQWYFSIVDKIVDDLDIDDNFDLDDWWDARKRLTPVRRFGKFLSEVLLAKTACPVVLFMDEIDSVNSLEFDTDDFFAIIRECYNNRSENAAFNRLTFALIGVATPSDLITDKQRTPFNIGRAIQLTGFEFAEASPLLPGLVAYTDNPETLLQAVLDWTGGQPFLTQKVCQLIQTQETSVPAGQEVAHVADLVNARIIDNWEVQDEPPHLKTIRDRILQTSEKRRGRLLGLYQRVLQGTVASDGSSEEQMALRLAGLVVDRQGQLVAYNRIYRAIFSDAWVNAGLAELRPYGDELQAWVDSDCEDESRLLRGKALEEAQGWAEGMSLDEVDYRFLAASQEVEKRVIQESNQILAVAKRKADRRLKLSAIGLALAGIGSILSIIGVFRANSEVFKANQKVVDADKEVQSLRTETINLEDQNRNAQKSLSNAIEDANSAQRTAEIARLEASKAKKILNEALQDAEEANEQREQALTKQKESELKLSEAEANIESAEADLESAVRRLAELREEQKTSEAEIKQAQDSLSQAHIRLTQTQIKALQTRVEASTLKFQAGSADQIEVLISILRSAREWQEISKSLSPQQKSLSSPSPALRESLQQVLSSIRHSFRVKRTNTIDISFHPWKEYFATLSYSESQGRRIVELWKISDRERILVPDSNPFQGDSESSVNFNTDTFSTETLDVFDLTELQRELLQSSITNSVQLGEICWATSGGYGVRFLNYSGSILEEITDVNVEKIAFSPDNRFLAVVSDSKLELWEIENCSVKTSKQLFDFDAESNSVSHLEFNASSDTIFLTLDSYPEGTPKLYQRQTANTYFHHKPSSSRFLSFSTSGSFQSELDFESPIMSINRIADKLILPERDGRVNLISNSQQENIYDVTSISTQDENLIIDHSIYNDRSIAHFLQELPLSESGNLTSIRHGLDELIEAFPRVSVGTACASLESEYLLILSAIPANQSCAYGTSDLSRYDANIASDLRNHSTSDFLFSNAQNNRDIFIGSEAILLSSYSGGRIVFWTTPLFFLFNSNEFRNSSYLPYTETFSVENFYANEIGFSSNTRHVFLIGQGGLYLWNADERGAKIVSNPIFDLPTLMFQSCDWLSSYFSVNPDVEEQDKILCNQQKSGEAFEFITSLSPEMSLNPNALADACWNAAVAGLFRESLSVCEQAIQIAEAQEDFSPSRLAVIYDVRGVVRVLNNDISGAISDFTYYLLESSANDNAKQIRREWIDALRRGVPTNEIFTSEVLNGFRSTLSRNVY
ncbi:MAG: AAA-like domain-containing protein [Leptolyngbyaceae cyanobacterium]